MGATLALNGLNIAQSTNTHVTNILIYILRITEIGEMNLS